MALFISGDRLSRYFPSAALEVFPATGYSLLTQVSPMSTPLPPGAPGPSVALFGRAISGRLCAAGRHAPPKPALGYVNRGIKIRVGGVGWVKGWGGALGWSLLPVFLFLLTGAGLFLMSRDTPHWLRVSVASPWNGGKL